MHITEPNDRSAETIGGSWRLDPQRSSVEFRASKLWGLVTVTGSFDDYEGQLDLSATPAIALTIDAKSLHTGIRKRDQHLRSADFFDAEDHPRVQFLSDSVDLEGDALKVHGRLHARGRSIPLELIAEVHEIDGELEIDAATTARHRDLGMTWSPLGMIRGRSQLLVKAHLTPDTTGAA